ncbi:MAG: hypothetical protein AB7F65_05835 [Dehalococcoidia bacterium]
MSSITSAAGSPRGASSPWLVRADRSFRLFGKLTIALLLATGGLIAADVAAWRGVFASAHLAALIALVPLGAALLAHAFREARAAGDPGVVGVVRRHRAIAILLAITLVTVAFSLANFPDGNRLVRRTANLTTVGIALALVWRYLAWARTNLPRR